VISLVLQTIIALPKIASLIISLIKLVKQEQERVKENNLKKAVDGLQGGNDDLQSLNETITRNLP
jgi:hypothetical protein